MTETEEKAWTRGNRAAWAELLARSLTELGYGPAGPEPVDAARLALQLERTRAALREVCAKYGDNDWSDSLHPADVIDKHLTRHLAERELAARAAAPSPDSEVADIEERLKLLRAASRPSEPPDRSIGASFAGSVLRDELARSLRFATAQGHILSAIEELERRAELLGKTR